MKQVTIIIAIAFIIATNLSTKSNTERLPSDAQDYIYSQDYPIELVDPINALSPEDFTNLLEELNTSTRADKQNILIETISL